MPSEKATGYNSSRKSKHSKNTKPESKPYSSKHDGTAELPGVQKIKASIRQTRRFLAKDSLAADVRVETERRLKSLEADLQVAETQRKERTIAKKYHKVKFFERKKVLRRIKQVKKKLDAESGSKKPSTARESELFELRVDLNYILHYPKLEKYISLFSTSEEEEGPQNTTSIRRETLREEVRNKMEEGVISGVPEIDIKKGIASETSSKLSSTMERPSKGKHTRKKASDARGCESDTGGKERKVLDDDFFDAGPGGSDLDDGQ